MRTVKITPVLNGFRVEVGCQELVFSSIEELCKELIRYQKNSESVEKEYLENAVNRVATVAPGSLDTERERPHLMTAAEALVRR
jgi:hypothetical protein